MTRMTPLLERNAKFAQDYTPVPLAAPTAGLVVVSCLDHRINPTVTLGLRLGEAVVIRNAGGRVTPSVVNDIAYLAFLAQKVFGMSDRLFEVAVVHHPQCGTGFLADPEFRREAAESTGVREAELEAVQVADPYATVKIDVERLLGSPRISPGISVSGHVYDIESGLVATVVEAREAHARPGATPDSATDGG